MESPYLYILPKGTVLFRATTLKKEGRWYNFSLDDAYAYGKYVTEYVLTEDLKLINIASLTFHNDFMDRLLVLYPGVDNTGYDIDKIKCLIPLGLVDISTQKKNLDYIGAGFSPNETAWNNVLEYLSNNLLNRHRLSEHSIDTHFVSILEKIYGEKYQGYISPIRWPTKMHGYLFPREMCMFKIHGIQEIGSHTQASSGGGNTRETIQCKPFTMNSSQYSIVQKQCEAELQEALQAPLKLYWNSHAEQPYTDCEEVSIGGKGPSKRNTRRKRKI